MTDQFGTVTTKKYYGVYSVGNGEAWKIGLLHSKQIGSLETETYTWAPQVIGSTPYYVMSPSGDIARKDAQFSAPLLVKKTMVRDGASYTSTYSNHDAYGNPQTIVETGPNGGNRTTAKTYYNDPAKWVIGLPKTTSFQGFSQVNEYHPTGDLKSKTINGVTTTYAYHPTGDLASTTFPRGLTHTYSNYKRGIAQYETQPEAIAISRFVSDAGNVESETNARGYTTKYEYDGLNRITKVTKPIGNPVTIAYTPTSKTATRGGLVETTVYDGFGRTTAVNLGGILAALPTTH